MFVVRSLLLIVGCGRNIVVVIPAIDRNHGKEKNKLPSLDSESLISYHVSLRGVVLGFGHRR